MDNRRSLLDDDRTEMQERADVFGDEFEVEDWEMGVADGFRPAAARNSEERGARQDATEEDEEEDEDEPPIRTVSAHYGPSQPLGSTTTRDSIRKSGSHVAHVNPFVSPEDAAEPERANSLEFEPETNFAHRTMSSASSRVYASTTSPRFGAGPSHPYGMYTQATVPRSPSVTTAVTTARQSSQRQSFAQNLPQHPYAMYPQAIDLDDVDADEDDEMNQIRPNPVPVGFPGLGLGQSYTRRLGPDGEDQGIIDDVGHAEQLPPYTRYPEDGPEKMPLLPPTLHSRAPVAGTDPSMPLMHTTIIPSPTPVPQSMTDESQRHSTAHSLTRMLSNSSTNTSARKSWQEKTWKEKTWREKRWTRFCGVPFWIILLAIAVIVFIAAVLGGVIGGYVAGGHAKSKAATTTVVTSLYDASLMPSPTSGGPPLGTFALELGPAEEVVSECLVDQSLSAAWDCNLAPNSKMGLSIVRSSDPQQGTGATLFYNSDDPSIGAGAQLPYMDTQFSPFLTVLDNDDKSNGLAFYFQSWYDKVVVVPEANLSLAANTRRSEKRGYSGASFPVPDAWKTRKLALHPGERPWFCVWNDTFVEGFIYVEEAAATSTTSSNTSFITSPPSTQSQSSGSPAMATNSAMSGSSSSAAGAGATTAATASVDIITTTISNAYTSAVFTGPSAAFSAWASGLAIKALHRDGFANDVHPLKKRQQPARYMDLPYLVKIEERRLAQSPQPYCQQYQILDNGNANIALGPDDKPIIYYLQEQDPVQTASAQTGGGSKQRMKRGDPVPNSCHCQWMSGQNTDSDNDGD